MLLVPPDLDTAAMARLLPEQVDVLNADLLLYEIRPLEDRLADKLTESRMLSTVFGVLASIGLALATVDSTP
jgi:hypothetical protein